MDNTIYEFFICRCWKCDRFKHGANTDTWEDLISKHYDFKNANQFNKEVLERNYYKKLNQIKDYLDKAFNKLISNARKKKVDSNYIDEFINYQTIVHNLTEPEEIWNILRITFPLMNDNNL